MKKSLTVGASSLHDVKKALLIMKFTFLLLTVAMLQVSARVNGQVKVSLQSNQEEIARVLISIEKQSNYRFLYNNALEGMKRKISINVHELDISEALNVIFTGTDLTYKMLDNNLIVVLSSKAGIQDIQVTGKITGENGEPLSGVSVTLEGSTRGTATNNNGEFTLTAPQDGTLRISYVGYQDQEVKINNQSLINVQMKPSVAQMDQVVVVGYGTQRKIDVTGATATVKGSELVKQSVLTPTQALQGKVAGVQIVGSGQPGSQPSVRIRGTGSAIGGAEPLYVVDGVITTDITNINNADIVSVDILKDASSTAIYGARGSNGVMLITTRQGTKGKMQISYSGNMGVQSATHLVKMANSSQYINYVEASLGPNISATGYSTDWFGQILRNAVEQSHNISLSGATDKTRYLLSIGYADDQGIVINNDFKRFTIRSNNEFQLAKNLKLGTLVSYTNNHNEDVDLATAYNDAYKASPTIPGQVNSKYGNTSLFQNVGNPILDIKSNNSRILDSRLQGNAFLEFKPVAWLTLRSSIGADWDDLTNRVFGYQFFPDSSTFITPGGNQSNQFSSLNMISANSLHWVWDNTATFNKRFGDHNFSLLVGTTAEEISSTSTSGLVHGVPTDPNLWYLHNGNNALPFTNDGYGAKQTRTSYISRLNYSFLDRYLLTANFRADASSNFPAQNRWGYFPSVGAGWVISKEDFMNSQKIFDLLKIRGSWGQAGNDFTDVGSAGYTLTLLQNLPYFFGGTATSGSAISQIVDQDLKWETTTESDVAIEFSSLKSRLSGEASYYTKVVKNALINVQIPSPLGSFNPTGGQGYVLTNAASVQNRGVELSLNWRDQISHDLSYSIGGNITFNQNKVVGLNGGQPYIDGPIGANQPDVTKTDNGQPIGSFYVQKVLGVFQNQTEIDNYKDAKGNILEPDAQPGDFKYEYNSNGIVDSVFAGSYQPKEYYGINLSINYKRFDLSVGGYGTIGGKIYNGKKAYRSSFKDNVEASTAENHWTNSNHTNIEPRANLGNLPASTYFVESGSYFRINTINLGYNLPGNMIQRTRVLTSLRVYLAAQNPFTFTKYSGFTPELQPPVPPTVSLTNRAPTTGSPTNAGIELNAYPTVRTFSIGVNIGF
jgi:TonB-dependent starch-binding outer membrane protein SusC